MSQRYNEIIAQVRQEPFEYRAALDGDSNIQYEGWAGPGTATSAAKWIIAKHTYNSNNYLIQTSWAGHGGDDQIWDNHATLF